MASAEEEERPAYSSRRVGSWAASAVGEGEVGATRENARACAERKVSVCDSMP